MQNYHFDLGELRLTRALFFCLASIHSLGRVLSITSARDLSRILHREKIMPAFSGTTVIFSLFANLLSGHCLYLASDRLRFFVSAAAQALAIGLVIAASIKGSLYMALMGSTLTGGASVSGGLAAAGLLREFDAAVVVGWTSGGGLAGLLAALGYLAAKAAGARFVVAFAAALPLLGVYVGIYAVLERRARRPTAFVPLEEEGRGAEGSNRLNSPFGGQNELGIYPPIPVNSDSHPLNTSTLPFVWRAMRSRSPLIFCVTLCSHSCTGFLSHLLTSGGGPLDFEAVQVAFHCGAFAGRSLFRRLKLRHLWPPALAVALAALLAFVVATMGIRPPPVLVGLGAVVVGFSAGTASSTVLAMVLGDQTIPRTMKEACIHFNAAAGDLGVALNSVLGLTVLHWWKDS